MDPRSFDCLARSLAAPRTRRGLIGTLAAVGAGLIGARAAAAQVSQASCGNVACGSNPGVCANGCVCCGYSNGNSRCRPASQCTESGFVIPVPTTTTTTTTAAPLLGLGELCTSAAQCDQSGGETFCEDQGCGIAAVCCRQQGQPCSGDCSCCGEDIGCLDNVCKDLHGG